MKKKADKALFCIADLNGVRYSGTMEHPTRFSNDHPACTYDDPELAHNVAVWLSRYARPCKVCPYPL